VLLPHPMEQLNPMGSAQPEQSNKITRAACVLNDTALIAKTCHAVRKRKLSYEEYAPEIHLPLYFCPNNLQSEWFLLNQ
jgi:hypothetical protein